MPSENRKTIQNHRSRLRAASKPPTTHDIAERAGVSQATVSNVLSQNPSARVGVETRARVLAAAEELGYTPDIFARSLRSGQNNLVLLPLPTAPLGPLLTETYDALGSRLSELGYTPLIHLDRQLHGLEAARTWAMLRPVGLYVETTRLTPQAVGQLEIAGTKAILGFGAESSKFVSTIIEDEPELGALAAKHLADKGHRRLGVIVPRDPNLKWYSNGRLAGVEQVALERNLSVERIDMAYDELDAARAVTPWRQGQGPRPDAIFAYNDEYAMLLIRALQMAELRVPEDIAVVGADNLPLASLLRPRLTTIARGDEGIKNHIVSSIAAMLHDMIQGKISKLQTTRIKGHLRLIVRESA